MSPRVATGRCSGVAPESRRAADAAGESPGRVCGPRVPLWLRRHARARQGSSAAIRTLAGTLAGVSTAAPQDAAEAASESIAAPRRTSLPARVGSPCQEIVFMRCRSPEAAPNDGGDLGFDPLNRSPIPASPEIRSACIHSCRVENGTRITRPLARGNHRTRRRDGRRPFETAFWPSGRAWSRWQDTWAASPGHRTSPGGGWRLPHPPTLIHRKAVDQRGSAQTRNLFFR